MASMNEKDYYAILEVDEKASTDEIRRAFQKKARKLHPDVNKAPDAEERFKEVSEAYAVLSDADKRRRYDAMRSGVPFAGGYTGGSGSGYGGGSPFDGFPFSGAGSQTKSRSYNPKPGADIAYELDIDFETAQKGTKRGVTYQRYAPCDVCNGSGSVEHAHAETCPTCGGAGRIRLDLGGMGIFGVTVFEVVCPECEGSGKVVADPCSACNGSGRVLTATEVVVEVPAGSHDGDVVRVEGKGNAGTNGRESGDFVCRVCVAEERLDRSQESGFRLIGFGVPMLVIGLIQTLPFMAGIGGAIVALGVVLVIRAGVKWNLRWWREGGAAVIGGAATGIIIGLLLMFSGPFISMLIYLLPIILIIAFISRRPR